MTLHWREKRLMLAIPVVRTRSLRLEMLVFHPWQAVFLVARASLDLNTMLATN